MNVGSAEGNSAKIFAMSYGLLMALQPSAGSAKFQVI